MISFAISANIKHLKQCNTTMSITTIGGFFSASRFAGRFTGDELFSSSSSSDSFTPDRANTLVNILSNNHTTFLYVILPQNIVLEEKLTQKIKCKVICGLFSGWKIWPCIVLPSMKVRLTTCYFSTDKVFSRYAYFILTMRQIVTWVLTLILTNKMLPAYVNWSRTRLETEGNWRCNLKST